jgi:hypothetical protein
MVAALLLLVVIVCGLVVGAFVPAVSVALKAVLVLLAVVGAVALFLRLGAFISGRLPRALIVGTLAALVTLGLAVTSGDDAQLIWVAPFLVVCGVGLDLVLRRVAGERDLQARGSIGGVGGGAGTTWAPPSSSTDELHGICPADDMKRIFDTEDDAWRAVHRSRERFERGEGGYERPLDHAYLCRVYDHWHVSSQPTRFR